MQSRRAYYVYPRPVYGIVSSARAPEVCKQRHKQYSNNTCPKNSQNDLTCLLPRPNLQPPYQRVKLAVYYHTHTRAMGGKKEVVKTDGSIRAIGVTVGILRAYCGGVEERGSRDGVAAEAEKVQGRKIDGQAEGTFAAPVPDGLRIEGRGPSWSVSYLDWLPSIMTQ
jgi:hypothetical protein